MVQKYLIEIHAKTDGLDKFQEISLRFVLASLHEQYPQIKKYEN